VIERDEIFKFMLKDVSCPVLLVLITVIFLASLYAQIFVPGIYFVIISLLVFVFSFLMEPA